MNFKLSACFILLALLISSFSCSNKSSRSRKPVVQINIESPNKKITYGDNIKIGIKVKLKDGEIQETKVFLDSTLLISSNNLEFSHELKKFEKIGNHNIKVVAKKTDGIEGVYYNKFEVLSNIIPEMYGYELVKSYPHSETFYTEGLEFHNGYLYEGTGENGKSAIYKTNLSTGKVLQTKKLADQYFGEGITILKNRIFQLTYKTKIAFVYNLENLTTIDSFHFESKEGWGLTNDDKYLIMSDGTNLLTFIDPNSYKTVKKIQVYDNKEAVLYLNELEYSDGFIYANVWSTNFIVKIDPQTGKVLQKIDLDGILSMTNTSKQVDVLNGIAIEPQSKKFCVTGKYYPAIFEIKLIKKE
jgi:glutaminyl-peptide cyclotransferase